MVHTLGVLMVQPYKAEILPHWRFATPDVATTSSIKIKELFLDYVEQGDAVGAGQYFLHLTA